MPHPYRIFSRSSTLPALLLACACSPDLSLLGDGADFQTPEGPAPAGAGNGGAGAESAAGGGAEDAGATGTSGGQAGETLAQGGAPASAGAGSSPCESTGAESCNGVDDDCNGTVDDGCPSGLTAMFEHDLEHLGDSPGGEVFTEDCKHSEVLAGVEVAMGAFLSQARGICRSLSLEPSDQAPHGYAVRLSNARKLAPHPQTSTDPLTSLDCPADEALVGVRISQQYVTVNGAGMTAIIPRVWLSCARLVLVEREGKLEVDWQGMKEIAPASGSLANGTAWFASAFAPQGTVASRLLGATGAWVDRIGFGVSRVEVIVR